MSRNRIVVIVVAVVVAAAALVIAGVSIGQRMLGPLGDAASRLESQAGVASPAPTPTSGDEGGNGPAPSPAERDGFVEFSDGEAGFRILVPQGWDIRSVSDPQVRMLATPNDRDSAMVRVTPLDFDDLDVDGEVTEEDLTDLHGFTEDVVRADDDVEVLLGPEVVEIAGTASTYYLYTFDDGDERGVHAHYFIFEGGEMITLVLQAIPEERFVELADVFDVIAESFSLTD